MTTPINIQPKNYVLETEIDQNEHFTTYQGYRKSDETPVLVRVVAPLYTGDEFFVRRFIQVTKQIASLDHPNIIPSDEAGVEGKYLFVAQDFVEMRTLAQVIENEGSFSPQRVQHIAGQIASALDYAHQKSVMHGDLSAHNIFLEAGDHVLITNFSMTQALFGNNYLKNAPAISSPETLAPERVHGQGPSRPADLYALGILCYYMLAKRLPFTGPASAVLHAQAHRQPRPLHQFNASVPLGVSRVISRMLSKGVELRYNTGAEFARALTTTYHIKRESTNPYLHLTPVSERMRGSTLSLQTFLYVATGLVLVIFVAGLFAWAGYELGLKQAAAQAPPTEIIVTTTIPIPTISKIENAPTASPTVIISEVSQPSPSPTQTPVFATLIDTLLPTPTPRSTVEFSAVQLITSTVSTPIPPVQPTLPPTPGPAIPAGQGMFSFYNPTGHDLIIDLTGPTPHSTLVPPYETQDILLLPGSYQYIVHTVTGEYLDTIVARFNLAEGQLVEKDYYSDFKGE